MFSASDTAFEGFRLAGRRPFLMVFWALAYTVATVVLVAGLFALIAPSLLMALMSGPGGLENLPNAPGLNHTRFLLVLPVMVIAIILLATMSMTAIYRSVLRPKERGFGYLALGGDEWRQILLMLLLFVVSAVAMIAAVALVVTAMAFTPEAWKALAGVAAGVVCGGLMIWVSVRLSLASAQTFAERRVTLFDSWALTRGRFWPLLGMWLLSAVLSVMVSLVVTALSYLPLLFVPGGLSLLGADHGPAWPQAGLGAAVVTAFVAQALLQIVGGVLQVVVSTAPGAAAYGRLKGAA